MVSWERLKSHYLVRILRCNSEKKRLNWKNIEMWLGKNIELQKYWDVTRWRWLRKNSTCATIDGMWLDPDEGDVTNECSLSGGALVPTPPSRIVQRGTYGGKTLCPPPPSSPIQPTVSDSFFFLLRIVQRGHMGGRISVPIISDTING